MALWGNNDNVGSEGTVSLALSGSDWTVTGSGTTFGNVGAAQTGDVIRIGLRGGGGTYYGDAAVVGIASTTQLTIGSTGGLSDFGASIASTSFYVSELPVYTVDQSRWSETHTTDRNIYGISTTQAEAYDGVSDVYRTSGSGWVGVTTYTDMHGNLRVKSEVLVAMSGITTGADGIVYPTPIT